MLAWPAKRKLVKLANDSHSGDPGCRPDQAEVRAPPPGRQSRSVTAVAASWWLLMGEGGSCETVLTCCASDQ